MEICKKGAFPRQFSAALTFALLLSFCLTACGQTQNAKSPSAAQEGTVSGSSVLWQCTAKDAELLAASGDIELEFAGCTTGGPLTEGKGALGFIESKNYASLSEAREALAEEAKSCAAGKDGQSAKCIAEAEEGGYRFSIFIG